MLLVNGIRRVLLGVAVILLATTTATSQGSPRFKSLLDEAGLEFNPPQGFEDVPVSPENRVFPYEHALRSPDGAIEVRYAIRPLSRIDISYQDPHSSAPHPNDLFKMLFDQITIELAGTRDNFANQYPADKITRIFNAHWAAVSLFDVDDRFSDEYNEALLVALHKDDFSDAYIICLFNGYENLRTRIGEIEASLRFAEPPEG